MATTFTAVKSWTTGGANGRRLKVRQGSMVTDGNDGASAGDIPASVFNLTSVEEVSAAVKDDNTLVVVCAPAINKASILGKAAATAAAADIPAGTYNIMVKGT